MAFSQFDRVPNHYAGSIIQKVKDFRQRQGKRALQPTALRIGRLEVLIPRHFGFCYGVENAIHRAFSALEGHPDKRIHLISEIIHNPLVNADLQARGINFLSDQPGDLDADQIDADDIVLIPAFGTTLQIEDDLRQRGIDTDSAEFREHYDTTCPFVSKVWKHGEQWGREGYTIVIHGKFKHEETQATHSHINQYTKTLVVLDAEEARLLAEFIVGAVGRETFEQTFAGKWSEGFDPESDLQRVAVVNQTTMLAEDTQEVASILRQAMLERYGPGNLDHHIADTSDTLCYATNQNQDATRALIESRPDLAVIVGGYNSSNTSHLVEICSQAMPSFLVEKSDELLSAQLIRHFDIEAKIVRQSRDWLPPDLPVRIGITSGASCPDVLVNEVIEKIAGFYGYGRDEIEVGLEQLALFAGESL
ncbi:MAG: 4-hydroxy-3-methylbut-2-enyl diphosphate reductase [Candidatus Latescibacteria bacterium]|nr:4-hydroxy-3-methylbut-2-enyl diphosphate reductase [Candidatus Latescibacterota bacterium]